MPSSRIPSPARSQGVISTPRKHTPRRSRSVCSARSSMSVRLTAVISDSFKLSPMPNRQSVLNDETDIEIQGRKSWWKKLGENSRDVMEVLESKDVVEVNNVAEEFDVEILSQEKKNYTLDLPESSDGESINSIVIPQRKLFTQKDNQAQKKFGHLIDNRETLAKLQKSHFDQEKDINIGPKNLFNQASKPRNKPAFPAALLNISSKTLNKTKEMPTAEVKGQVRNLFGNRPGMKRKNMFADFIVSDSEDEIPDIQPKVFGFQKNIQKRRESSASRGVGHSPTSSIDLELDEWKLLPSSTMVENQLEEATTPVKRARLSKLSEAKESETTYINSTVNKTKQSNKSVNSKNNKDDLNPASKTRDMTIHENNQSLNSSDNVRLTRNRSKSIKESSFKEYDQSKLSNKSKNTSQSKQKTSVNALVHEKDKDMKQDTEKIFETTLKQNDGEIKNTSMEHAPSDNEEDFTLEYENDDEQIIEPIAANTNDINNENNIRSTSKANSDLNNKTLKAQQVQNKSNENNDVVDAGIKTGSKETLIEINKVVKEKQGDTHEQDNIDTTQIEKQEQYNKKQDLNQRLGRNSDKTQNKNKHEEEINESQNTSKHKNKIVMNKKNTQETTQKGDQIENVIDSEHLDKDKNVNKENETRNKDNEDNEIQNESEHNSNHEQENQNECIDEAPIELKDEHEQTQNEIEEQIGQGEIENETEEQIGQDEIENETEDQTNQDKVENETEGQSDQDDVKNGTEDQSNQEVVENETEDQSDQDDDENETEDQSSQDEVENETEDQTDLDEIENKTEDQADQDESEVIESDDQDQNDVESSENETEEQQNESMQANQEENESEEEEQNETEAESENADSDDNVQNESNLSLNENEQEGELHHEQSDLEDNEIAEDEVANDHDTTGRHRKKDVTVKSPEAILHDKTNQIESFTAQGRNTSVRKTKSIIRNLNIRPSLAPVRESTGISDGTRDSSAEGSGWDSHRTTRKTIRLTLGKDFTPRKSLRALVMEKSAKRNTNFNEVTTKIPQANSTELPAFDSYQEDPMQVDETVDEPSEHEVSARTRQTTLEMYLQKIKHENLERKRKMEEEIRASLKAPTRDSFNSFKMPLKPVRRIKPIQNKPKTKQIKSSVIPLDMLPAEVLEDMKYKPPKRFQPSNASWITKRLYKFLESKLEPKYDYKARVRAERLVELLYSFTREVKRSYSEHAVDTLKREMARLDVVKTHFDFYQFFHEFMPREIRVKVVPDVVNKISLPRNGVFSDIIQ